MGAPSLSRSQLESSTPDHNGNQISEDAATAGLAGLYLTVCSKTNNYDPSPGRCLLMMCAVSVALVMLEWIRTSYFSPSDASR